MNQVKLSVVIPSYNESKDVKIQAIEEVESYLSKQGYGYEVLIVDDESTNGTLNDVKELVRSRDRFRVIENKHAGKAITVMTGLLESVGEIALFTDMDQATPIDQLAKLLPKFDEGYDIAIGSRSGRAGAPIERKIVSWGFSVLRNVLLGLPFSDTQCGFKAFNRGSIEIVFPLLLERWKKTKRGSSAAVNAGFDVETLFLAKKRDLKIAEVKVDWHYVGNEKQVQVIRDSLETIQDMTRIRLNDLSGKYS